LTIKSYIISRALIAIPMTIFLFTLVFVILRVIPGDPINVILGPRASPELRTKLAQQLGLDAPLHIQYFNYLLAIFRGDFGISLLTREPVISEILKFFPHTVELTLGAMFVALICGIPLGISASQRRGRLLDIIVRIYGVVVYVIPIFWFGLMLQLLLGVYLGFLPVAGIGPTPTNKVTGLYLLDFVLNGDLEGFALSLKHLILPSLSLGLVISGVFARLTRTYMVETLKQDYTLAAETRGLQKYTIVYKYGLRNALLPLITMIGLEIAGLLSGAVLTEVTFSWPGLGTYLVSRIGNRDYAAVQGSIVFFAIIMIVVSFVVDLVYAYLDPRVKL